MMGCLAINPSIAVLLAAYRGEDYILAQLKSIAGQVGVSVSIYVSVDPSKDNTLRIVEDFVQSDSVPCYIIEPSDSGRGAAANFFHLLREVDVTRFAFVALADQDDIWLPFKLLRAITMLRATGAMAYSSDVTAFFQSGKTLTTSKSSPLRKYDFYFEAAGPGCTYVMNVDLIGQLRSILKYSQEIIRNIYLHDWFIYFYVRKIGYLWVIDPISLTIYRQHSENLIGVNSGLRAFVLRLKMITNGSYFCQVALMEEIFSATRVTDLGRPIDFNQLFQLRRRKMPSVFLFILLAFKKIRFWFI